MDIFQRLEALIETAHPGDVEEASGLLRRFRAGSQPVGAAVDEFMLDFKTLVFIVEAGDEAFEKPVRKLARSRLAKLQKLVTIPA